MARRLYRRYYVFDIASSQEGHGPGHPIISDLKLDHLLKVVSVSTFHASFMFFPLKFRVIL